MYVFKVFIFLFFMMSQSLGDIIFKDDFQNPKKWKFISDQVMGGVSSGEASYSKLNNENQAYISGNVSTKNNGGFIQIRRSLTDVNLKNAQSIKINASGNNQEYFLHLRTKGTLLPWQYYQLRFKVQKNFQNYNLRITDFKRSSFFISKNIIPEKITSIGIVAFGRDHEADLKIKNIEFVQ
jgi:hypothetical protein